MCCCPRCDAWGRPWGCLAWWRGACLPTQHARALHAAPALSIHGLLRPQPAAPSNAPRWWKQPRVCYTHAMLLRLTVQLTNIASCLACGTSASFGIYAGGAYTMSTHKQRAGIAFNAYWAAISLWVGA